MTKDSDQRAECGHRRLQKSTRSVAPPKPSPHGEGLGSGFAANIYGAMPEGLLIAGFPRIVSLPLEGKVPRRGG